MRVCVPAYPDVGVLVVPGKKQHVIQSQHAWRDLSEIHGWIHMILGAREMRRTRFVKCILKNTLNQIPL